MIESKETKLSHFAHGFHEDTDVGGAVLCTVVWEDHLWQDVHATLGARVYFDGRPLDG